MTTQPRTRLSPQQRREQLLDLGVRLFASRSLDEISIDLLAQEAGISRGLLYHYFGDKVAFREAVVRRAAADLVAQTEPPSVDDPIAKLQHSVAAYVDFVDANYEGYLSLVRGAASDPTLRAVYDEAFAALGDRFFKDASAREVVPDTAAARLLVRGWQAMTESLVLDWKAAGTGLTREELLEVIVAALPALMTALPG